VLAVSEKMMTSHSKVARNYELKTLPLDKLWLDEADYRQDLGDLDELAGTIKEKGIIQPITVRKDGKVLAGRRRFRAAGIAGLTEIPCIIRDTADELDEREIELIENLHRKDPNWREQVNLLTRIHNLMIEKHGEGWTQERTAKLVGRARSAISDAVTLNKAMEIVPELANSTTADQARKRMNRLVEEATIARKLADANASDKPSPILYAADHYHVGNTIDGMRELRDGVAHFAEVDPPYAIDLKNHADEQWGGDGTDEYAEIDAKDYPKFIKTVAAQVYRCLDDHAWCVWWFGPSWHSVVLDALRGVGFKVDDIPAIWYKEGTPSLTAAPNVYLNRGYEPFFCCRKGAPELRGRGHNNVFVHANPHSGRDHVAQRPLPLMEDIVTTFAYPGARILVPFLGSGTTLIAAYKNGMTGWGYDLSEKHKRRFLYRVGEEFPELFTPKEDVVT
jgi:ParB/RepB/Spo0J family partition protein